MDTARTTSPHRTTSSDRDAGATMMEYALVVGAVALVVVGATAIFGEAVADIFRDFSGLF